MRFRLFFISFFLTFFIHAQDFQGIAIYQSKTKFDIKMDSTKVSSEQQKAMKQMMKRFGEKTYKLQFSKTASIYKEEEKIDQPSQGGMRMFGGFNSGILYKNVKDRRYVNRKESFSKEFLIKDSLPVYEWKFIDETKMIGDNLCFKATTTKEVSNIRMRRPRRGKEKEVKENDSLPKTKIIDITAWYTPDIPINNGPRNFWGLPGLILELNEGKTQLLCTKIVINPKDKIKIEEPTKGKEVTQKEFDEIMEKKAKEMMEMYGGGRKKGNGGTRIMISTD
jgi:GLPGLI family protein